MKERCCESIKLGRVILNASAIRTGQHVNEIRRGSGTLKHEA